MIEVLTLKQLSMHDKALVFLNIEGFYDSVTLFEHFVELRFAKPISRDLVHVATTPEDAMEYIETMACADRPEVVLTNGTIGSLKWKYRSNK